MSVVHLEQWKRALFSATYFYSLTAGHGSSPSFSSPHTLETCAEDVARTLEFLNVEPQVMVGHSYGGKVRNHLTRGFWT